MHAASESIFLLALRAGKVRHDISIYEKKRRLLLEAFIDILFEKAAEYNQVATSLLLDITLPLCRRSTDIDTKYQRSLLLHGIKCRAPNDDYTRRRPTGKCGYLRGDRCECHVV